MGTNCSNLTFDDPFLEQYIWNTMGPRCLSPLMAAWTSGVYILLLIFGLFGNVLTCLVIVKNASMRNATNYYLFSLALSDLLSLIFGRLYRLMEDIAVSDMELLGHFWMIMSETATEDWAFSADEPGVLIVYRVFSLPFELRSSLTTLWPDDYPLLLCKLRSSFTEMTSYASVLTITAFSIERWLAICFPFKIQLFSKLDRALKVIACIWLVALLAASPLFGYTSLYRLPLPFNANDSNASSSIINYSSFSDDGVTVRMTEKCSLDVNNRAIQNVLIGVSFWLFFIVPYLLISVLYLNIGSVLRKNASNNIAHDSISDQHCQKKIRHRKNTVVRMLVAVVVTFFVCWLPFHIQRLSTIYINFESLNPFIMECFNHLFFVSGYFYYANAVVNPILYSIMNKKFRQALCATLSCRSPSESSSSALNRRRLRGMSEEQCLMARLSGHRSYSRAGSERLSTPSASDYSRRLTVGRSTGYSDGLAPPENLGISKLSACSGRGTINFKSSISSSLKYSHQHLMPFPEKK